MRSEITIALAAALVASSAALNLGAPAPARSLHAESSSRRDFCLGALSSLSLVCAPAASTADGSTPSGLSYKVVKSGKGGTPIVGDLIAIRFKGTVAKNGAVFDDILASAEPYYTRVGSGNVLPGVEEAVKLMKSGDVWDLTLPADLAFGAKGRSASPGKPRIPSGAIIDFTLELVAVPGKDEEIIEVNDVTVD